MRWLVSAIFISLFQTGAASAAMSSAALLQNLECAVWKHDQLAQRFRRNNGKSWSRNAQQVWEEHQRLEVFLIRHIRPFIGDQSERDLVAAVWPEGLDVDKNARTERFIRCTRLFNRLVPVERSFG
jgi:hypothetical protein